MSISDELRIWIKAILWSLVIVPVALTIVVGTPALIGLMFYGMDHGDVHPVAGNTIVGGIILFWIVVACAAENN